MIVRFTQHSLKRARERLKIKPILIFNKMLDNEYIEVENDGKSSAYYVYSKEDRACIKLIVEESGNILTVYKDFSTSDYDSRRKVYSYYANNDKSSIVVYHYIFKDNFGGSNIYIKGDTFVDRYIANNHVDIINCNNITSKGLSIATNQLEGNNIFKYSLFGIGIKTVGGKHTVYKTDRNKYYAIMEEKEGRDEVNKQ